MINTGIYVVSVEIQTGGYEKNIPVLITRCPSERDAMNMASVAVANCNLHWTTFEDKVVEGCFEFVHQKYVVKEVSLDDYQVIKEYLHTITFNVFDIFLSKLQETYDV